MHDPALSEYFLLFVFVGEGSEKMKLMDFIKKYNLERHVAFHHVPYDRMNAEYGLADIFVAPSKPTPTYEEQYCTALLEAQACGLPIVTTKSGGIPENVGDAGIIVEPGNVAAIATALKMFILYPKKRAYFSKIARDRALTVHDAHIGGRKTCSPLHLVILKAENK